MGEKTAGHCTRAGRWCGGNREYASRYRRELLSPAYIANGSLGNLARLGLNEPAWAGDSRSGCLNRWSDILGRQSDPLNFKAEEGYQRRLNRLPSTSVIFSHDQPQHPLIVD